MSFSPLHSYVLTIKIAYLIPLQAARRPPCPRYARQPECVTQWDCWDSLIALLSTFLFCCRERCYSNVSPTKPKVKGYARLLHATIYLRRHFLGSCSLTRYKTVRYFVKWLYSGMSRQIFRSSYGIVSLNSRRNSVILLFIGTKYCHLEHLLAENGQKLVKITKRHDVFILQITQKKRVHIPF